ncbi:MAE_28990/MAE_18760 family HEPN-like nuclease [Psychrobacter faecalis]|uniref:MAE_28990/MAE_18760 family HEPN-like nuclease n=1 Tax=Psychrobacter faecalis TaxID=180588 RepID=UPI003FD245B3
MNYFDGSQELYNQRDSEILEFIEKTKSIDSQSVLTELQKREFLWVIKSNIILMQYNLIESVFVELFSEFYSLLKESNFSIDDMPPDFFYNFILLVRRMPTKNLDLIKNSNASENNEMKLSNLIIKAGFDLTDEEKKFLVNGNLDGKKIKDFLKGWGFDTAELERIDISCLKTLKDQRQLLAHGGMSFAEQGRTITWEDIERYNLSISKIFAATKELLSGFFT